MHTRVHLQVKNGRCKSELELAGNVSFKGVSYVTQKTEGKLLTSKYANVVGTLQRLNNCSFRETVTTLPTQLSQYIRERVCALLNGGENVYSIVRTRATFCHCTPQREQGCGL